MPELANTRFGTLEFSEEDIIRFENGLIGFDRCRRFVIISTSQNETFRWLQSLDEPSLAFLVVDPARYVDGYSVEIGDEEAAALGIDAETPTLLLTTASIPNANPQGMTLNLAGPIVINAEARVGRQLIMDDESIPTKHPVFGTSKKAA